MSAAHPSFAVGAIGQARIWRDRADALIADGRLDGRALIGGQRVAAQDGQTFACHSPIDGRLLTPVARGQAADVDAAARSAHPCERPALADMGGFYVQPTVFVGVTNGMQIAQDKYTELKTTWIRLG